MKGDQRHIQERALLIVGLVLICAGLLFNEWIITKYFSPDGILGPVTVRKIWVGDAGLVVLGLVLIIARKSKRFENRFRLEPVLKILALFIMVSTFLKAIIDVDLFGDTWAYHLPFAARIWGIVPQSSFEFSDYINNLYNGFPLLGEFLQGFFWFVSGRPQSANLVSYLSLVIYLCFLKAYCRVPLYASAIALLAVPLIQIHATSCYVDLPANLCTSIVIMMSYLFYTGHITFSKRNMIVLILAAATAANMKLQLIPIASLFVVISLILMVRDAHRKGYFSGQNWPTIVKDSFLLILATSTIFFTPLKNTIFHGNPAYPIGIKVGSAVLNHKYVASVYDTSPDYLKDSSRLRKWSYSVMEVKRDWFDWAIAQGGDATSPGHRMGGYFFVYVLFQLFLILLFVFTAGSNDAIVAIILIVFLSLLTAVMPQSHELRYYMYWMMVLVSINLHLVIKNTPKKYRWIPNIQTTSAVEFIFLSIVIIATHFFYVSPWYITIDDAIKHKVHIVVPKAIKDGEKICLVGRIGPQFLYSDTFHPGTSYVIRSSKTGSECGNYRIIFIPK